MLLGRTGVRDSRVLVVSYLARAAPGSLNRFDNLHRLVVRDLAEDYVLPIEPAGDDSCDEELGAVSKEESISMCFQL